MEAEDTPSCEITKVQPLVLSSRRVIILGLVLVLVASIFSVIHWILGAVVPLYLLLILYFISSQNYTLGHWLLF